MTDPTLQSQIDRQILEQGAYAALDFLFDSGRLIRGDYERWRRREIESLDDVLMGSKDKILAQLESAAGYARDIGLVETSQDFHGWTPAAGASDDKPLRISDDVRLHRLIGSRYVPAQTAPQLDLFFDNPVVALTNGIVRALCARNIGETQRQLDRLYAQAPNHADLPAFDRLLDALGHHGNPPGDPRQELEYLRDITPAAKRLLGWEARDLLGPLWLQLADAMGARPFSAEEPELHRSFALIQAQDWPGAGGAVRREPEWWRHGPLCLRLALSGFHQQRRGDALQAWFHFCWRSPCDAAEALESRRQPDRGIAALWRRFVDSDEEPSPDAAASQTCLAAEDFPAWLLLREPGLTLTLPADLPNGDSRGENAYRCVHRWIDARRARREADELGLRKTLQILHPVLFRHLKRAV